MKNMPQQKGKNVQYYRPQSPVRYEKQWVWGSDLSMIVGHNSPQMGAFEDNNCYP